MRTFRRNLFGFCICILFLFIALSLLGFAQTYSVPLLSVSEEDGELKGSIAEAHLEVRPGTGRMFIDCFPFNKMDLQVSTRYARDLACKLAETDCSKFDFFYVIRADASIIGGPSAGSSLAFLTFAALKGLPYDKKTVATGTINAGYIVGPVGGLKEKIEAAAEEGLKKVLIPAGQGKQRIESSGISENSSINLSSQNNSSNLTLIEYGSKLGVDVVEIFDLYDMIYEYSGRNLSEPVPAINSEAFSRRMKNISQALCGKAFEVNSSLPSYIPPEFLEGYNQTQRYLRFALNETTQGNHYSAASFCFSSLTDLFTIYLSTKNLSEDYMFFLINLTSDKAENLRQQMEREYSTLGDLQVYAAVIERLNEAETQLENSRKILKKYQTNRTALSEMYEGNLTRLVHLKVIEGISYGVNRVFSAELWSDFFGFDKKKVNLEKSELRKACVSKVSEASGLLDYFSSAYPSLMTDARARLNEAEANKETENYALCIYQASAAKAHINNLMTSTYLTMEYYNKSIQGKIKVAERQIAEQQDERSFPIMGYSYLEYSKSLHALGDLYSASLYADYALELSNLDVYFDKASKFNILPILLSPFVRLFFFGALLGFSLAMLIVLFSQNRKHKKK